MLIHLLLINIYNNTIIDEESDSVICKIHIFQNVMEKLNYFRNFKRLII